MFYKFSKRLMDLFVVVIFLPFFVVSYCIIALLIKLDSKGSVILKQERIGKDMRRFMMYKFRTMYFDSDINGLPPTGFNDLRVTNIGRILRKSSLDELPQLLNVLLGDMSLVGPRPEIQVLLEYYSPEDLIRFKAIPGITGLWQISGRKDMQSISEKAKLDIEYINKANLLLDLIILIKTPYVVIKAKGAY
jgi:lipopolysaccharide/colanic/teichoic acid biosynthesis glycosyltransferase